MILAVRFSERYGKVWTEMSAETWAAVRVALPEVPEDRGQAWGCYLADDAALRELARLRVAVSLDYDHPGLSCMLVKLQDRLDDLEERGAAECYSDGSAVAITIPDVGLLLIDEVDVLTDACTDALQQRLDEGWRILAVCPPCAQRRPDYVLGRRRTK